MCIWRATVNNFPTTLILTVPAYYDSLGILNRKSRDMQDLFILYDEYLLLLCIGTQDYSDSLISNPDYLSPFALLGNFV